MSTERTDARSAYRRLPSVDEALRHEGLARLVPRITRALLATFVEHTLDEWRAEIKAGALDAGELEARLAGGGLEERVERLVHEEAGRGVVRAINATGVVLHTGLGRAPVHPEAAERMARAAAGYCVLEVDRFTGERNQRDDRLSQLLGRLTGAEAAIAVNNNAAATFLTLHTFGAGRAAIVSRGELVEIGGSFRIPDVMASANVRLVEVGATNRTRIADYERAIDAEVGLLMKVHTSNFRLVGFTEDVSPDELAELGVKHGLPTAFDLGSGRLEADGAAPLDMLGGETLVRDAVKSGIDVVTFSGDKLLGGPQAGLVVGHRASVEAMRANPIYRAMRLDKVALAGLEATLGLLLAGRGDEIPVRAMLLHPEQELAARAASLAGLLSKLADLTAEVVPGESEPGSGSAPGVYLDTQIVRVTHARLSADALAAGLRAGDPPVFARIQDGALLLDPRTLLAGDEEALVRAFEALG